MSEQQPHPKNIRLHEFRLRSTSMILPNSKKKSGGTSPIKGTQDHASSKIHRGRKTHSLYNLFAGGRTVHSMR